MEELPFSPMRRPMPISTFFLECFQSCTDRVLHHVLVLLQLLEHRGLLEPEPDEHSDRNQDHAGQERNAPQPTLEDRLVGHRDQGEGAGAQEGAELDPHEGKGSKETTTAARRHLGDQRCCARLLRSGTQALDDAEDHQEHGTKHARLLERRQQPDGEAGRSHQADGQDQHHLPAEPVPDVAEDDAAEGPGSEADAVRGERGDECALFAQRLEEQRSENQRRSQTVNVEVVVLQGGAHGAGKSCPSQLFRIDDGAVRISQR